MDPAGPPSSAASPSLCRGGCGFYGSASFANYCSKCYRELQRTPGSIASSTPAPPPTLSLDSAAARATPPSAASAVGAAPAEAGGGVSDSGSSYASSSTLAAVAESAAAAAVRSAASSTPLSPLPFPGVPVAIAPSPSPLGQSNAASAVAAVVAGGADVAGGGAAAAAASASAVNRSRCASCKKKVGLTGFECRCGSVFCGLHRYADQHACSFDFVAHDRAVIAKANQRVVGDKVEKI